jgi:hypothetical protein
LRSCSTERILWPEIGLPFLVNSGAGVRKYAGSRAVMQGRVAPQGCKMAGAVGAMANHLPKRKGRDRGNDAAAFRAVGCIAPAADSKKG